MTTEEPRAMPVEGSRFDAATWPPAVIGVKNLGYVNSASEPFYSRDIGRSFMLDGRIYYMFGDTFCNDAGISDNTYQVVPNIERPTEAFYLTSSANGHVAPLIKKTIEDDSFLAQPENRGKRLAFWCFGGVAEVSRGVGWLWYQKHVIGPGEEDILLGVGVARICVDSHTIDGALSCSRESFIPFKPDLPLFGSFSTLVEGNYVYLWGQIETDVYLARAPRTSCHQPFAYEYWNGHTYVDDVSACCRVFKDMQSGQIFRSDLFGAKLPWLFVGVSRFGDSVMRLGAAPRIEGPFDIQELFRAEGAKVTDRYTYCMYPHPWAAKNSKGKLLVTWCDPWPGGVLAAKVRFDGGKVTHWSTILLDGYSYDTVRSAITKANELALSNKMVDVTIQETWACETSVRVPGELAHEMEISGIDQMSVRLFAKEIRDLLVARERGERTE